MMNSNFGALEGLVVLDLTQMLAGPFCTQLLADHGAEVIKIEPPTGDVARTFGPFLPEDEEEQFGGYFQSINRNKYSIVLDLKKKEDINYFKKMAAKADVVVENFREGVMERLGVGFTTLSELNPKLVYASIRGFGDSKLGPSPYQNWPAYDVVAQAMSGLMGITGTENGPIKIGPGIGDIVPGMMAAFGIVSAVLNAKNSGKGQYVDISMSDTLLALCERIIYQYSYSGEIPSPEGRHHPNFAPFGIFPTKDGFVTIACPSDKFWTTLCHKLNKPEWIADIRFSSNTLRAKNRDVLNNNLETVTQNYTKEELLSLFGGVIPFGPILDAKEIFADEHFNARGMLHKLTLETIERPVTIAGIPMKLSRTPGKIRARAPMLGEHTSGVLKKFNLSE